MKLRCRTVVVGLFSLLLVGLSTSSHAAPPAAFQAGNATSGGDAEKDPDKLFKRGKKMFRARRYQESYQAYKSAWELRQSYDIAANLGNVELKLNKYADAAKHLSFALDNLPPSLAEPTRSRAKKKLKERLASALEHVGAVKLAVSPEGAELAIDGQAVGKAPLAQKLYLEPGKHELVAQYEGYRSLTHQLEISAGSSETVRLELVPNQQAPTNGPIPVKPGDDTAQDQADSGPILPLVIVGYVLAAGGIGAGIGLLVASGSKKNERLELIDQLGGSSACYNAGNPDCEEIENLNRSENTFKGVGIGMLVGGIAAGIATTVYLVWPRDDDDAKSEGEQPDSRPANETSGARWRAIPYAVPSAAGLFVQGTF